MKKMIAAGSICCVFLLFGCNGKEISDLQQENKNLKEKVQTLESENAKLKETADFHYKAGIDFLNSKDWPRAKEEFEAVMQKFPKSELVANAQNGHAKANANILAEEKAQKIAEAKEKRAKEESERLAGTPINYAIFYAKAHGGGLPIGKRYRFSACVSRDTLCIYSEDFEKPECASADFDSTQTLENFHAASGRSECGTITASMGYEGRIHIHRINGQ